MSQFVVKVIAFVAISIASCSVWNEPNEGDYWILSSHYDVESIGLLGIWSSNEDYLFLEFTKEREEGYYIGSKNCRRIYWQVIKYSAPSNTGIGVDIEIPYGYVRILGENKVGESWYFEVLSDDLLYMISPRGITYELNKLQYINNEEKY